MSLHWRFLCLTPSLSLSHKHECHGHDSCVISSAAEPVEIDRLRLYSLPVYGIYCINVLNMKLLKLCYFSGEDFCFISSEALFSSIIFESSLFFCHRHPFCLHHPFVMSSFVHLRHPLVQCCGAATFLGGSGSRSPRFRSRLWLRLQPTWIGSGSRHKKAAPAPYTKIFHFELLNSELLIQVYCGPYLPF